MGGEASTADLAAIRRGFELFNAGDLDALHSEVFDPEIDYSGDPQISVLTGLPVEVKGGREVLAVWEGFFAMFDDVSATEIAVEPTPDGPVLGSCRMLARGGASEVPIDALFHFAWVLRDERWRFMAVKLRRDEVERALADWLRSSRR